MTKLASIFVAVSLAMTASVAASAQDRDKDTATLRVDRGSVMTSQGGEFATAQTGQVVMEGNRLMVAENSAATLIFSENCERQYTAPGVYTIEEDCDRVAAIVGTATGFDAAGAATVVAGSLGVAAILYNMEDSDDRPPVQVPVSR